MITRKHFRPHYKAGCAGAPPPLHVISANPEANHYGPQERLACGPGATAGPALILGGTGMPCLGIDPTDESTWDGRGYYHSSGMIARLNFPPDDNAMPYGLSGEAVPRGSW